MHRATALLIGLLILTAGCLGATEGDEATTPTSDAPGTAGQQDEPRQGAEGGEQGASATGSAGGPTADLPPAWILGEWWEIELTSPLLPGETITWTRVMAGFEGSDYLVGQPKETWEPFALLFHLPGLGEISQADLSYEVHDARFHPLQFPLQDGQEWETQIEGLDVTAQVTENDDGTFDIWYCCGRNATATYDPALGVLTHLTVDGLLTYNVVDHGYGFEGIITVPHGHDLVFVHGRVASVLDINGLTPAAPVETMEISDDYGRVTFAGIVGDIAGQGTSPTGAAYTERVTGPDGTVYETTKLPGEPAGLKLNIFETTELGGTWELEHVAAGPGIAFTEGIAYHVFDVQMPQGTLLGDHSEHMT